MNKQGTMRTRNTKKAGQTPPAKNGSKTPVKGQSVTQSSAATDPVVATSEPEITLEVQIHETKPAPEPVDAVSEFNGYSYTVADTSPKGSSEKSKELDTKPTKTVSSPPANKQRNVVTPIKSAIDAGEGAVQTKSKETGAIQCEVVKSVEEPKEDLSKNKKDSVAPEVTKVQTEVATQMEVEDGTGDDVIEEIAEEDGEEEEEGEEDEEEEDGEGRENKDGIENEVEEEEENKEGNEEVEEEEENEEEGGDEEDEVEGGEEVQEHPELQEPRPVTERLKRKHFEVFVGGLDKETTEDDLKKAFKQVGDVVKVRLLKYTDTGKNKGYAFVRFATPDQATRAATELKMVEIKGKSCPILPRENNDVLFVGNVNKSWKKEQVEEKLKEYGIKGIDELIVMEDHKEGLNRGFAFIEFGTHKDATDAFKRLAKPDAIFGSERSAKVAWAYPNETDAVAMHQVKSVYVGGVPSSWTEDKVKGHFGKYGEIERILLTRKRSSSRQNGYAIVNYATREAAIACIDAFKNVEIADGEDKVILNVRFDKLQPKAKVKGNRIVRGSFPVGQTDQPGRGRGTFRGQISPKKPSRGGRGFGRGGSRPFGRGKRAYEGPGGRIRALRQREAEEERLLPVDRSSDRRSSGGYSRQEDVQRSRRQSLEYRNRRDDIRDDHYPPRGFLERLPSRRHSGRDHPLPPPRGNGYLHRADRGFDYGRDVNVGFSRARDYGEPGPGMKRSYSSLDEDLSNYESAPRGFPRARVDYDLPPPSQYDSLRAPVGRSSLSVGAGRAPVSLVGGPVSPSSLGLYDLPGTLGGSSLGNTGGSSLYGAGDYISSGAELRASALYGGRSGSGGYSYLGATSGTYY